MDTPDALSGSSLLYLASSSCQESLCTEKIKELKRIATREAVILALNEKDSLGNTTLFYACKFGWKDFVDHVFSTYAQQDSEGSEARLHINSQNIFGQNLAHFTRDVSIFELIIRAGVDMNVCDRHGFTPLISFICDCSVWNSHNCASVSPVSFKHSGSRNDNTNYFMNGPNGGNFKLLEFMLPHSDLSLLPHNKVNLNTSENWDRDRSRARCAQSNTDADADSAEADDAELRTTTTPALVYYLCNEDLLLFLYVRKILHLDQVVVGYVDSSSANKNSSVSGAIGGPAVLGRAGIFHIAARGWAQALRLVLHKGYKLNRIVNAVGDSLLHVVGAELHVNFHPDYLVCGRHVGATARAQRVLVDVLDVCAVLCADVALQPTARIRSSHQLVYHRLAERAGDCSVSFEQEIITFLLDRYSSVLLEGYVDARRRRVSASVEGNVKDDEGKTPLYFAAKPSFLYLKSTSWEQKAEMCAQKKAVVDIFLARGAMLSCLAPMYQQEVVTWCMYYGWSGLLQRFIKELDPINANQVFGHFTKMDASIFHVIGSTDTLTCLVRHQVLDLSAFKPKLGRGRGVSLQNSSISIHSRPVSGDIAKSLSAILTVCMGTLFDTARDREKIAGLVSFLLRAYCHNPAPAPVPTRVGASASDDLDLLGWKPVSVFSIQDVLCVAINAVPRRSSGQVSNSGGHVLFALLTQHFRQWRTGGVAETERIRVLFLQLLIKVGSIRLLNEFCLCVDRTMNSDWLDQLCGALLNTGDICSPNGLSVDSEWTDSTDQQINHELVRAAVAPHSVGLLMFMCGGVRYDTTVVPAKVCLGVKGEVWGDDACYYWVLNHSDWYNQPFMWTGDLTGSSVSTSTSPNIDCIGMLFSTALSNEWLQSLVLISDTCRDENSRSKFLSVLFGNSSNAQVVVTASWDALRSYWLNFGDVPLSATEDTARYSGPVAASDRSDTVRDTPESHARDCAFLSISSVDMLKYIMGPMFHPPLAETTGENGSGNPLLVFPGCLIGRIWCHPLVSPGRMFMNIWMDGAADAHVSLRGINNAGTGNDRIADADNCVQNSSGSFVHSPALGYLLLRKAVSDNNYPLVKYLLTQQNYDMAKLWNSEWSSKIQFVASSILYLCMGAFVDSSILEICLAFFFGCDKHASGSGPMDVCLGFFLGKDKSSGGTGPGFVAKAKPSSYLLTHPMLTLQQAKLLCSYGIDVQNGIKKDGSKTPLEFSPTLQIAQLYLSMGVDVSTDDCILNFINSVCAKHPVPGNRGAFLYDFVHLLLSKGAIISSAVTLHGTCMRLHREKHMATLGLLFDYVQRQVGVGADSSTGTRMWRSVDHDKSAIGVPPTLVAHYMFYGHLRSIPHHTSSSGMAVVRSHMTSLYRRNYMRFLCGYGYLALTFLNQYSADGGTITANVTDKSVFSGIMGKTVANPSLPEDSSVSSTGNSSISHVKYCEIVFENETITRLIWGFVGVSQ